MVDKHGWDYDDHEMAKYVADDVSLYQTYQTMFWQPFSRR